mmetsp:Transcript_21375/g.61856  ORF Transcript_21375/g.61856 Transcript_21375/m.61856 type:complete len:99 (-) Transcript_21375:91-387(-)
MGTVVSSMWRLIRDDDDNFERAAREFAMTQTLMPESDDEDAEDSLAGIGVPKARVRMDRKSKFPLQQLPFTLRMCCRRSRCLLCTFRGQRAGHAKHVL